MSDLSSIILSHWQLAKRVAAVFALPCIKLSAHALHRLAYHENHTCVGKDGAQPGRRIQFAQVDQQAVAIDGRQVLLRPKCCVLHFCVVRACS